MRLNYFFPANSVESFPTCDDNYIYMYMHVLIPFLIAWIVIMDFTFKLKSPYKFNLHV